MKAVWVNKMIMRGVVGVISLASLSSCVLGEEFPVGSVESSLESKSDKRASPALAELKELKTTIDSMKFAFKTTFFLKSASSALSVLLLPSGGEILGKGIQTLWNIGDAVVAALSTPAPAAPGGGGMATLFAALNIPAAQRTILTQEVKELKDACITTFWGKTGLLVLDSSGLYSMYKVHKGYSQIQERTQLLAEKNINVSFNKDIQEISHKAKVNLKRYWFDKIPENLASQVICKALIGFWGAVPQSYDISSHKAISLFTAGIYRAATYFIYTRPTLKRMDEISDLIETLIHTLESKPASFQ
jgi:hypothetical protein